MRAEKKFRYMVRTSSYVRMWTPQKASHNDKEILNFVLL